MAILTIYKNKNKVTSIELDTSKEYIGGRAPQCDIILDDAVFSRQHFKLYYKDGYWCVQSLSKYSQMTLNGAELDYFKIKNNDTFKTFTFHFTFESTENFDSTAVLPTETNSDKTPVVLDKNEEGSYLDDKTYSPGVSSQDWSVGVPYLIIQRPDETSQTLRLEGDYWVIGRDDTCDVIIDDVKSSREHCEIFCKNNNYYIIDKNSSNGTVLNFKKISPEKETPLRSGDQIQIGKLVLIFEVRDPHFVEKISHFPALTYQEDLSANPLHSQKAVRLPSSFEKNKKIILTGGAFLALFLVFLLSGNDSDNQKQLASKNNLNSNSATETLTDEQKYFVEKSYNLAKTLYTQGKYELALTEIEKIHGLTAEYKDSREIAQYSKNAVDTLLDQKEIERKEQDQIRLAEKVDQIVDNCSKSYSVHKTLEKLDDCLTPATELDPENNKLKSLRAQAEQNEAVKDQEQDRKSALQSKVAGRKKIFQQAESYKKSGKLLDAISTYGRHIASTAPDPENLEQKSKQEIKNLQQRISQEIQKLKGDAETLYSKKNYKEAIKKLELAIRLNPQNQTIKDLHSRYSKELLGVVKNLYGDSVLEENLGNIEAAKEKWKKIRDTDVEYGEYFRKAGSKLKKYGL